MLKPSLDTHPLGNKKQKPKEKFLLFQAHFQPPQSASKHLKAPEDSIAITPRMDMPTLKWLAMNQNYAKFNRFWILMQGQLR